MHLLILKCKSLLFFWTKESSTMTDHQAQFLYISPGSPACPEIYFMPAAVHYWKPWSHTQKTHPSLEKLENPFCQEASSKLSGSSVEWLENTRRDTTICNRTEEYELLWHSRPSHCIEKKNTSKCYLRSYFLVGLCQEWIWY